MTNTDTLDLYEVTISGTTWRFNNTDQDEIYDNGGGPETFQGLAVKRTKLMQTVQTTKSNVEIQIPIGTSLADRVLRSDLNEIMSLTIYTRRGLETFVAWKGRLANWKPNSGYIAMNFESVFTSLRRPGLRPTFQRSCRHALYSTRCGVDPATFEVTQPLFDIFDVTTLIFLGLPALALSEDYFVGGYLETPLGARSYIIAQESTNVTIQRLSQSLIDEFAVTGEGLSIKLYPGCNYTRAQCISRFDNLLNYGGFDWIPTKNPTGGGSIV